MSHQIADRWYAGHLVCDFSRAAFLQYSSSDSLCFVAAQLKGIEKLIEHINEKGEWVVHSIYPLILLHSENFADETYLGVDAGGD